MRPPLPWKGFLIGFLFGTAGLWIIAMARMGVPMVETVTEPLYAFGRLAAEILIRDGSASTGEVMVLMGINGVVYGLIGAVVQLVLRWMR